MFTNNECNPIMYLSIPSHGVFSSFAIQMEVPRLLDGTACKDC